MNNRQIRLLQKAAREENRNWPTWLKVIPREEWPVSAEQLARHMPNGVPTRALRSCRFIVQIFDDRGTVRISVNRAEIGNDGKFAEGITWDELQQIKAECGYGDCWAVEIFPAHPHLVNVSNMRHLWILKEAPPFGWRK